MPRLILPVDGSSNEELQYHKPLRVHQIRDLYLTLIGQTGLDVVIGGSGTGLPLPGSTNTWAALEVSGAIRASGIVLTGAQTGVYSSTKGYFGDSVLITGGALAIENGLVTPGHISGASGIFTNSISTSYALKAAIGITGLSLSGYPVIPSGGSPPTPGANFVTLFVTGHPDNGSILLGFKLDDGTTVTGGPYI